MPFHENVLKKIGLIFITEKTEENFFVLSQTSKRCIFEIKALRKIYNSSKSAILNSTIISVSVFQMARFLFHQKTKNQRKLGFAGGATFANGALRSAHKELLRSRLRLLRMLSSWQVTGLPAQLINRLFNWRISPDS